MVGIGASAGGLEACTELLQHLPAKTGLAFAIVQHLDPKHPSHLSSILQRSTELTVVEAEDGTKVQRGHVYIIPPNVEMRIADEVLHLTPRPDSRGVHLPIDEFFRSLANECDGTSIGVVLSGNASDGTEGLKAIKASGGITFAQDEKSARYAGMPRSAAAAGCVDFVLPPAKIAEEIARLGKHPFVAKPRSATEAPPGDGLKKIYELLRAGSGVDFSQYKQTTIARRLQRRMAVHRLEDLDQYGAFLETHPDEVDAACQDVLIHVTSFFREPETFAALKKHVLPALLRPGRPSNDPIRIWLPGCSTGEEAYSLAICFAECLEEKEDAPELQIFGTDVSERVVEQARKGVFAPGIEADVSPARLRRFFTRVEGGWQVAKSIRDRCIFARQNVIKDPPFSKMDLVSCRNVLIYFEPPAQKKLIPVFHYALKSGGWLLLGSAESVGAFSELFESVDAKSKLFVRRPAERAHGLDVTREMPAAHGSAGEPGGEKEIWSRLDVQKEADRVLMARYCPPSIVVGENFEIIQFRGSVAPFLEPASGDASLNLFRMTRPAIEIELRAAITRAKKIGAPVRKENVRIGGNGGPRLVNLDVIPLGSPALREHCFVVLFEECPPEPAPAAKAGRGGAKTADARVKQLEDDLAGSREHLQSVIEEHEATNEELRSANEEIQSSNEELQSTNEELETAKEELQSANEELTTVNEELKHTNLDLGEVNSDLGNLLRSVNIPILLLDRELRIRRFTPGAEKVFRLVAGDAGRMITELRLDFGLPGLEKMLGEVRDRLDTREAEVRGTDGHWWRLQVRPYESVGNQITGVILILFDIDAAKREAEQRALASAYAEAFVETMRGAFLVLDGQLRVKWATGAFYQTFHVTARQTEGRLLYELGSGQWDIPRLRALLEKILPKKMQVQDFKVEHDFPHIGKKRMLLNARRIERDPTGEPLILLAIEEQAG